MAWDERQTALLAEIGVRLWQPQPPSPPAAAAVPPPTPLDAAGPQPAAAPDAGDGGADAASKARVIAIQAMDWPALEAAVAACTACGLHHGRRHTVFGVGHRQAHWLIVGEAPGEQEDLLGEPFVGKAGALLDNMLRGLGLARAPLDGAAADPARQVFIANVLKCRPPMNRNPQPDEVARCQPLLSRQIALLQPRLILALGRFAVQSLLATDLPIGKLRGRVHDHGGVPVVVSYHPAYLLRNPADKARAWDDLCLARSVADQRLRSR